MVATLVITTVCKWRSPGLLPCLDDTLSIHVHNTILDQSETNISQVKTRVSLAAGGVGLLSNSCTVVSRLQHPWPLAPEHQRLSYRQRKRMSLTNSKINTHIITLYCLKQSCDVDSVEGGGTHSRRVRYSISINSRDVKKQADMQIVQYNTKDGRYEGWSRKTVEESEHIARVVVQ